MIIMKIIKIFLTQILFFITCSLLIANTPEEKVYDFYQLKKDQRPVFVINGKPSSNPITDFTGFVNRAQGANFKVIADSIKISSEQKVFNVTFVVNKEGSVTDITVDSDNENVRELFRTLYGIKTEGQWLPGKIKDNPVLVRIPFIFSLKLGFVTILTQQI